MKEQLLLMLLQAFLKMLNPELIKKFFDAVLDYAEDYVLGTASDVDDKIVLPICNAIREALSIPDNDE